MVASRSGSSRRVESQCPGCGRMTLTIFGRCPHCAHFKDMRFAPGPQFWIGPRRGSRQIAEHALVDRAAEHRSRRSRWAWLSGPSATGALLGIVFAASLGAYLLGVGAPVLRVPGAVAAVVVLAAVRNLLREALDERPRSRPATARGAARRGRSILR
jgi:hypothetical protein